MQPTALRVPVADGVCLHVRAWHRDGDGPPFLLVHGLSSNARLWDGVARGLAAAGHPAYAVDLRSHGGSDRPPGGYDTATSARDLDAVCGALGLSGVVAAGQSWGGNVVVQFAARFPERVVALGLVDGGWLDLAGRFATWEACERELRPPDVDGRRAAELRLMIATGHPDWQPWAVDATMANFAVDGSGAIARRLPVPQHLQILRSMWDDPPQAYYPAVTVQALLAFAARAGDAGREGLVADAAAALRGATVRAYRDADHDLHAQHPDRLAADLLDLAAKAAAR
jgi:pimeloyl-ACP methyl ester carboxylesterase